MVSSRPSSLLCLLPTCYGRFLPLSGFDLFLFLLPFLPCPSSTNSFVCLCSFDKFTIGHAWRAEYGYPDIKEHFEYLLKYSPYHNVPEPKSESEQLPAILISTADHDDRVIPAHSFKMTARLQEVTGASEHQKNPLLLRVTTDAGHGAGVPLMKMLEERAEQWAFVKYHCRRPEAK